MKNEIKLLILTITFIYAFSFCVSAQQVSVFTMNYSLTEKDVIEVLVSVDDVTNAAGLDFTLNYDTSKFELQKTTVKVYGKNSDKAIKDGGIRYIWETAENDELPKDIMYAKFKKRDETAEIKDIRLQINEFYDDTIDLEDIDYEIKYKESKGSLKTVSYIWVWLFFVIVLILIGLFLVYNIRFKKVMKTTTIRK